VAQNTKPKIPKTRVSSRLLVAYEHEHVLLLPVSAALVADVERFGFATLFRWAAIPNSPLFWKASFRVVAANSSRYRLLLFN